MARARKFTPGSDSSVVISDEDGLRSLHIGGLAIQSAMRTAAPDMLALHYTQAMMAFLLFEDSPADILMIGLGGGSIAKFVHRRLPGARMTVVELRDEVVRASRAWFELPPDDDRLSVVVGDGAKYLPDHPASADVLLLDGFDDGEQPAALCTRRFYESAFDALRPGGLMVVNFMADDPKLETFMERIQAAFGTAPLRLPAADGVNTIAIVFREGPARIAWKTLRGRAAALGVMFDLPFARFVASLKRQNAGTAQYLTLASSGDR